MHGNHMLTHWSNMQSTIALSSGEAELNAAVKGASEGIGIQELLKEWNVYQEVRVMLMTGSYVAQGTITRRGSGKMKHLTAKQLWIQEAVRNYDIDIVKINREINSADLLTHQCPKADFDAHLYRLQVIRL